jgi:phage tail sheath protein FI
MPEYLSPGVYVEEIDTGSKPIEGVSTSTAGMLGLTERGPANVPMLVTNTGDYAQMFGGLLDRTDFGDRGHLPLAVDGFFRNGGRRLYVTRVLSAAATPSAMLLHNRGELGGGATAPSTALLIGAHPNDAQITVMEAAGIAAPDRIRMGGGSGAEWREVSAVAAAAQNVVLDLPLSNPSAGPAPVPNCVQAFAVAPAAAPLGGPHAIVESAVAGSQMLLLQTAADLTTINPATQILELRRNGPRELIGVRTVTALGGNVFRIALTNPLALTHAAGGTVNVLALGAMTAHDAVATVSSGDVCILYNGAALGAGEIVEIVSASGAHEFRRQAQPGRITLARPLSFDLPHLAPVEHLVPADASVTQLLADAATNARTITVADRTGFTVGGVLRVGVASDSEFITIAALPGTTPGTAPVGAGAVTLVHGLGQAHHAAEQVTLQNANLESAAGGSVVLGAAARGEISVLATDISGYTAAPGALRTVDGSGVVRIVAIAATAATAAQTLTLAAPALTADHGPGATVGERQVLVEVQALDAGSWGDRLLTSIQDESSGLVTQAFGTGVIGANRMVATSLSGIEPGTVLSLYDGAGHVIEPLLKVNQVNRADNSVTLVDPLAAPQVAALGAPGARVTLRSREFRLMVTLLQRPSPAQPWRADTVEDTEVFRQLSMDPRHSRYIEKIIGQIGGALRLSDRRPEGESLYIRVRDTTPGPALPGDPDLRQQIRLGPEALVDILPSGLRRPARHPLAGGDDGLALLSDLDYLGKDDRDPAARLGIPAMKNIDEISIVAAPGIVSAQVQGALIEHCEARRYCFAVLDGPAPPDDAIADVQALRQNFDTRYAAVYYPWLTIPDPMPGNLATIAQTPIPPSGHMLGVYARTDVERGVHKAPANEVVRGITGLRHYLNKAEQDILNPHPSNINVIRDFRLENRAIRAWGARVMTSDPDYKYVPVRRLLLFIEKSIERNMNWVVFEPNAEPLWARVRLSITGFLTTVWRNGALEGTSTEQAFFVNCDRSTMTQADIDNGRLICVIGVAAVKPAEYVIIRVGLKAATSEE